MNMNSRSRWLIFFGVALSIVMVDVDLTAVNLALPTISESLNIGLGVAQWVIDGYSMAIAVLIAFGALSGDFFGQKRTYEVALLVFILASVCVGLSENGLSILTARILQGASVAFIFPLAAIIVRNVFPSNQYGFAMGLLLSIAGISQALGPTLSGLIIHFSSWRWIFFVNIPIGLLSYLLISGYFIENSLIKNLKPDYLGLIYLVVGLFSLLVCLNEVSVWGASIKLLSFLGVALASFVLFIYREWHYKNPLLKIKLILNQSFSAIIVLRMIVGFVYFSWLFLSSILLQNGFQYSVLESGLILLPMTGVIALLAAPVGRLVDKLGYKRFLIAGVILMAVSSAGFIEIQGSTPLLFVISLFVLSGVSMALLVPATATAVMHSHSNEKMSASMGVFFTGSFLGGSLGIATSSCLISFCRDFYIGMDAFMYVAIALSISSLVLCRLIKASSV